jgi:hypothetical protein
VRTKLLSAVILAAVFGPAHARGQSLEDMLAKALKQNPDILVAEAKVREAEAELNRVRQHVLAKIVALNMDIEGAKDILRESKNRLDRLTELRSKGQKTVSDEEYGTAQVTYYKYLAEHARKKADLPLLLGKQFPGSGDSLKPLGEPLETKSVPTASTAAKFRAALEMQVNADFGEVQLDKALEYFQSNLKGVNLTLSLREVSPQAKIKTKLVEPVSLLAALQLLEDKLGIQFIVREYGIVAVDRNNVPPGALSLSEFAKLPGEKTK